MNKHKKWDANLKSVEVAPQGIFRSKSSCGLVSRISWNPALLIDTGMVYPSTDHAGDIGHQANLMILMYFFYLYIYIYQIDI